MKLIQLNIWQGKILIAVSKFLKEQNADIVTMQEVFSCPQPQTFGLLDMLNSLETLQKELNYPYVYFEPTCTLMVSGVEASFGNAILSKYPLTEKQVFFTNGEFYHIKDWPNDYQPNNRNALLCAVETPEGNFTLVGHHGFNENGKMGSENSVAIMKKLADRLQQAKTPLIIAGDLNVVAASPAMRVFDGWLENLTATHNIPDTLTEFGKVRNVACDHILVSKEVKVTNFEVSEELVSDHKALILNFEI